MKKLLHIFLRELYRMAHRRIYWFAMVIAPLLCYVFFVTLLDEGLPEKLPVGLVDNDRTATTRSLARTLDAFQQTHITGEYASVTEARVAVQRGEIYGFFYIPEGMTRAAQRQEMPTVSFYMNYSYLVAGSLVYRDMRTLSELASGAAARSVLYAKGATEGQAKAFLQPISVEMHPLNNPWVNYSVYLTNYLLPGLLLLFVVILTVYTLGTEMKDGTARHLLDMAEGNMLVALTGKLLAQCIVFLLMGAVCLLLLYAYLDFPCRCGLPTMFFAMGLAVLASQSLGVVIFSVIPSLRMGMSVASLWSVLAFSMAGVSFPVMAMNPALHGLATLFPLRHYFLIYVNSALNGYPLHYAWTNVAALMVFILLPLPLLRRLKKALLTYGYEP